MACIAFFVLSTFPAGGRVIRDVRPRNEDHRHDSTPLLSDLQCGWILGAAISSSGCVGEHVGGLLGHDHFWATVDWICSGSRRSRFNFRSSHSLLISCGFCPHCGWDHLDWASACYRENGRSSEVVFLVIRRSLCAWLVLRSLSLLVPVLRPWFHAIDLYR